MDPVVEEQNDPMSTFSANTRCECQARLSAVLDEHRHVVEGHASRLGETERAPAHSINAELEHFDIAWLCPFCGRNTLRTFFAGALRRVNDVTTPSASAQG